ncbi:MAG: hypothetical protein K8F30_08400 [Taibaiella sp.]|nr:hypothetical protein [Taibaiella sp.]
MMRELILIIPAAVLFSSCGDETYTCKCTDKGDNNRAISDYEIKADDKSQAAFECKQKSLTFSGNPEYKDVQCEVE